MSHFYQRYIKIFCCALVNSNGCNVCFQLVQQQQIFFFLQLIPVDAETLAFQMVYAQKGNFVKQLTLQKNVGVPATK